MIAAPMDINNRVNKLKPFEHTWVALVDDEVIASGESVAEVKRKAEQTEVKHCVFYLVPSSAASLAPATVWH
jgi:Family of unknown function (DUF5678)